MLCNKSTYLVSAHLELPVRLSEQLFGLLGKAAGDVNELAQHHLLANSVHYCKNKTKYLCYDIVHTSIRQTLYYFSDKHNTNPYIIKHASVSCTPLCTRRPYDRHSHWVK